MILKSLLELPRYKELINTLVSRNLKTRYRYSILGYAWTWLDPLMMMLVFILVFDVLLNSGVEHFPLFLLCGLIPWTFFSNTIGAAVASITNNAGLIKRVYYPREIFPLTLTLTHGVNMLLSCLVLIPVILFFGVTFTLKILWFPATTIVLFFFAFGLGLILATLNVFLRDMMHIVPLIIRVWFFSTPIFYDVGNRVPERLLDIYMFVNPMAVILTLFRASFMNYNVPKLRHIVATFAVSILVFIVGYILFKRNEDLMVKRI
jgi:ABC-2 type transport system permease protein